MRRKRIFILDRLAVATRMPDALAGIDTIILLPRMGMPGARCRPWAPSRSISGYAVFAEVP